MRDPLDVCRMAAVREARNILDMEGAVAEVRNESVERRSEQWRKAIVEQDVQAASLVPSSSSNAMARRTEAGATS